MKRPTRKPATPAPRPMMAICTPLLHREPTVVLASHQPMKNSVAPLRTTEAVALSNTRSPRAGDRVSRFPSRIARLFTSRLRQSCPAPPGAASPLCWRWESQCLNNACFPCALCRREKSSAPGAGPPSNPGHPTAQSAAHPSDRPPLLRAARRPPVRRRSR